MPDKGTGGAIELTSNWQPLEARLAPAYCEEFMWMFRQDGVEHYKHIISRLYLMLTGDGRCVVRKASGLEEVDFEQEWNRVTGRITGDTATHAGK